jgi:hypothetical protein
VGSASGGTALFAVIGVVAVALEPGATVRWLVLGMGSIWLLVWYGSRDKRLLPYRRGQLPRRWTTTIVGSYAFGFAFGLGLATHVTSGLLHLSLVLAFLSESVMAAALAGAAFGSLRAIAPIAIILSDDSLKSPGDYLVKINRYMRRLARVPVAVAAVVAIGVSVLELL